MYVYVRIYVYVVCVSLCYTHVCIYLHVYVISQVRKCVRSVMTLDGVILPVTAVNVMLGHSVELGAPTAHCVTRGPSPSESVVSFPPGNDDVTSCGD